MNFTEYVAKLYVYSMLTGDNPDILRDKLQRLPVSLAESVEALAQDSVLEALLGEKLLVAIKGVRKVCVKHLMFNF